MNASMGAIGFPPETLALFVVTVLASVIIDLRLHRNASEISLRDAGLWSLVWVGISLSFAGYLYAHHSPEAASLFLAGYVLEKSLSVDNLMVFIAVFSYFKIRGALQHRILYYGILGAIFFRLLFVSGAGLLQLFGPWADALFAFVVLWSAISMLRKGDDEEDGETDYSNHAGVRLVSKWFAVVPLLDGNRFFVRADRAAQLAKENGSTLTRKAARYATPMLVCLAVIELSDVLFSFDSVPTVIAVTHEPVLVYSAMIFAILGLRSLYFVLAALTKYLAHLEKAIIGLLFFIAAKLGIHAANELAHLSIWEPSPLQSLAVIGIVLTLGVIASAAFPEAETDDAEKKAEVSPNPHV